ncbi:transposase [Pleurocapsales cyanobacterium LEGE 06147]|nr:transposase [Pleurocapsales cyanobacterium LEGE 06147]
MKTYKFKLYESRKNRYLKRVINASASIYNHCIALFKRYYRMFKKHLNHFRLMKHIAKLRNRNNYWKLVGSQVVQDIIQRIKKAYDLFFNHHKRGVRPPGFKKVKKYKSFTLKQAGYKFLGGNRIKIIGRLFKFAKSREIQGKIKTLTVKRNYLGELFIQIVTDYTEESCGVVTGKIAGFDFGLKTFLTVDDGTEIQSPLFFNQSRNKLKYANRNLSRKEKNSRNWYKAKYALNRVDEATTNKRKDWFGKLANDLTNKYDVLIFETLNLAAMKRLWGRKISDLAFRTFLNILEVVASKKGKIVHYIDKFFPSSRICFHCGYKNQELELKDRFWDCPNCKKSIQRDLNAARNIKRVGASTLRLEDVRLPMGAILARA